MTEYKHFDSTKEYLQDIIFFFEKERVQLLEKTEEWVGNPENTNSEYKTFITDTTQQAIQKIKEAEDYLSARTLLLESKREAKKAEASKNLPSKKT